MMDQVTFFLLRERRFNKQVRIPESCLLLKKKKCGFQNVIDLPIHPATLLREKPTGHKPGPRKAWCTVWGERRLAPTWARAHTYTQTCLCTHIRTHIHTHTEIQNTQEIERTLFDKTKQDKPCKFSK